MNRSPLLAWVSAFREGTLADLILLGIFEDAGQRDFHVGLTENVGAQVNLEVIVEPRLTDGCRFDYLAAHLKVGTHFDGVIIGVDGKRHTVDEKIERLLHGITEQGLDISGLPILWSVALPSIEEWLTGDRYALPDAIKQRNELNDRPAAHRPGGASAEQTAKARLKEWTRNLSGAPPLRGGLEYAEDVGRLLVPSRVGSTRNPDLHEYVCRGLPEFLRELADR